MEKMQGTTQNHRGTEAQSEILWFSLWFLVPLSFNLFASA